MGQKGFEACSHIRAPHTRFRTVELRNSSFIMESAITEKSTGRLVATSRAAIVHYDYTENRARPLPDHWRKRFAEFEGREF